MLTVSVAFGQTPYKLNYPDITIGNSPTGKIVLNAPNLRLPRIADGSLTDSVLTIVSGVIKKVPRSQIASNLTFINGLTKIGDTVLLGGELSTGVTSIGSQQGTDPSISLYKFGSIGISEYSSGSTNNASYINLTSIESPAESQFSVGAKINNGTIKTISLLGETGRGLFFKDEIYSRGIALEKDYSKTWNVSDSNYLAPKAYVDRQISSLPPSPVTSVNGRTGAVTGLAELNQNNNFTGNQTIAGRLTVNGTAGTSSATGPSAMTITGGNGWSNTATSGFASGGAAGPITMRGGNGGNSLTSSGTQLGGKGGGVEIIAGNGGLSGTSGTNGNGGDATLQAGSVNLGGTNPSKPGDVFLKGGQNDVVNGLGGSIYILPGFGNANSAGVNADLTHDGNVFLGSNINGARRGAVVVGSDISDITNDFQVTGNSIFKGLTRVGATTGNNLLIDPNPGGNVKIRAFNNGGNQALEYVGGEHIFDGQLTLLSNISVPSYRANDFVINHENSAQKISLQNTGTNKLEVLSTGVRINNLSGTGPRMVGVDATGLLTAQGLVSSYANINGSNATGTWPISVTGNSATTTKWGGIEADFTQFGVNLFGFLAYNEFGMGRSYSMAQVKTALGIGNPPFETSGTSAMLVSSGRYIPQNAALTIYTLPTTANVGDVIFINGKGAGGWRISQNTGQVIHGATDTTVGSAGFVASTARYNSIAIVCVTANTEWIIQSSQGSLTIN